MVEKWHSIANNKETTWRRYQMVTFSVLLVLCAGNSPVTSEFPSQRPVTRSFDVFFDLCLNKRLSKQLWGWWFETPPCSWWRHCNECVANLSTALEHNLFNGCNTISVVWWCGAFLLITHRPEFSRCFDLAITLSMHFTCCEWYHSRTCHVT